MASHQSEIPASSLKKQIRNEEIAPGKSKSNPAPKNDSEQDSLKIRTDSESPAMARNRKLRWILGSSAIGYCLSFFFHSTVLTVFAFITFTEVGQTALNTIITETEELENVFTDSLDTKLEIEGIDNEKLTQPRIEIAEAPVDLQLPDLSSQLNEKLIKDIGRGIGQGSDDGKNNGSGKGGRLLFKMPTSGKVVTKGSFTAWTEPEDPRPGQDYYIIIQIELPKRIKRYRVKDLTGMVIGTDDYVQEIPGRYKKKSLPVKNHKTQFVVRVPGAHALVEDKITIQSKILDEKQTLQIVF